MKEESLSSLTPGVHLIIVCPIRESRAFRDESLHPRLQHGMRQVPVSRFELGTGCRGARLLAAFRVHFNEATNFGRRDWTTAGPFALSSTSLVCASGHWALSRRTASNVS